MEDEGYHFEDTEAPEECCCPSPTQPYAHAHAFEGIDDISESDARSETVLEVSDKGSKRH